MDKYLQQILREVNTIIIPGLGALTVTNERTGETMFMSYLKYDDGKLSQHIVEKEGMSENEAKNLIAKYVREITLKLDQGETYDMFQFGRFLKNKEGDVDFENWKMYADNNTVTESPEIAASKTAEAESAATIVPPTPVTPPAPSVEVKTETPPVSPKPAVEPARTTVENTYIPAAEMAQKTVAPPIPTPVQPATPQKQVPPTPQKPVKPAKAEKVVAPKPVKPPKAPKEPRVRKKRSVGFWIFIGVVALLAIAIPVVAVYYDQFNTHLAVQKEKPTEKVVEEAQTPESDVQVPEENTPEATTSPEPMPEVAPAPVIPAERTPAGSGPAVTDGSKPFHIIGGAFGLQANADKFAEKLNSSGGHAVVLGQYDNLFLVSIDAFSSKEEADQALKSGGIKGWVFKKK